MHNKRPLIVSITSLALIITALLVVMACTSSPPVQEMSNARQALRAARDAGAERFASHDLSEAENLLRRATLGIEQGDYVEARHFALAAQEAAAEARVAAIDARQGAGGVTTTGF